MRVVQINVTYEKASTGRTSYELSNYMKDKGVDVLSFTGSHYINRHENILIATKFSRLFHMILSRLFGLEGYGSYFPTIRLIKKIKIYNPDIIHLRVLHGSYLNQKLLFKFIKKSNIPVVWTFHDCWAFTGKCAYYTKNNCSKWVNQSCDKCMAKKEYPRSEFFDFSKMMLKDKINMYSNIQNCHIIAVSKWLKKEAKKSFFNQYPINHIYNWIDLNKFHCIPNYQKKHFSDKFVILGVASGWSERKGIIKFLELSQRLSDGCIIVLIGKYAGKMDIDDSKIRFIEQTEDVNELVNWYNEADVFLNLSIEETFGKVSAEALSCGTPVITNCFTANKELVDEKTGIVLSNLSINHILSAINTVKVNKKQYYKNNCRLRAEKLFNYHNNCNQYYELYKKIIELKG